MECIVTSFVTALREEGLRVSPGETLDAVRAIVLGGVGERSSVKAMLRMTLVKRVADFFHIRPGIRPVFQGFKGWRIRRGTRRPSEWCDYLLRRGCKGP